MVPPNIGCGWHTSAECVALALPAFSKASSFPAGPSMKNDLIAPAMLAAHSVNAEKMNLGDHPLCGRIAYAPSAVLADKE